MARRESRQTKWARAGAGAAAAAATCGLCLRVVLDHGPIGALVPASTALLSAATAGLGGFAPLFLREERVRGQEGGVRLLVEPLRDWLFFSTLLGVLFACAVVMQFSTGHGDASSVYYQAFALSAIFLGTAYAAVMYLATVYYPFERRISWMWVQAAIGLALVLLVLHWERQGRLQWHTGLRLEGIPHSGAIEPEASHCQIGLDYWRLRYAFPRRFFNLWAGSLECDDSDRPAMALRRLPDGSRELLLDCKEGEQATYMEGYPFLRSASERIQSLFPRARLEEARRTIAEVKAYDREHPPVITAQHVQGFCGQREAALVQAVAAPLLPRPDGGKGRKKKLNILLVMLDAVSRAEFHYSLPTTARAMEDLNNNALFPFSVFEFFRYQTTGKTTLPNLTSLFSGMSQPMRERHVAAWHNGVPQLSSRLGLIFRQFKKEHQRLMFSEEEVRAGANDYTTALLLSFCSTQLEVFWNTTAAEQLIDIELCEFFCHGDYTAETLGDPFKGPYSSSRRCIAGKPVHKYMLEMMESILENAQPKDAKPAFVMAEFLEGHETSLEVLSVVDEDLAGFLEGVAEHHPDTLTFVLSDHGNHMTMLANYPGGEQEQGLGSLFAIVPDWLFAHYPSYKKNMAANQQKIVTMADVYATLLHLSVLYGPAPDFPPPSDEPEQLFTSKLDRASEGLLRHIPDRTCAKAKVPPYRCRCEPLGNV